jgi:hypothetical protein
MTVVQHSVYFFARSEPYVETNPLLLGRFNPMFSSTDEFVSIIVNDLMQTQAAQTAR